MCALKALFTGVIETPVGRGALSDAVAESLRSIENLPGVACPSWPLLARLGRVDRGAARPFIGVKRSRRLLARNDAIDPGCVKTPQARERLELFFPDRSKSRRTSGKHENPRSSFRTDIASPASRRRPADKTGHPDARSRPPCALYIGRSHKHGPG